MITTKFAKASERTTGASPFCLIEQKGLMARLGEELSRAANDLFHDPRGFIRDLVSPADTKDQKRRRLVYIGLGCALVAHAVLLTVMIVAGWHRILAPPRPGDPPVVFVAPRLPAEKTEVAPKAEANHSGGGGGQLDSSPPIKGDVLPPTSKLAPIIPPNVASSASPDSLVINPTIQGIEAPPVPGVVGDPNGKSTDGSSGGPGTGGGVGNGAGPGVGDGRGIGGGLGSGGNKGDDKYGTLDGKGTVVDSLTFNGPKPLGYVPFSWIYRPTPVVTPEAQANKPGGTVILMATFRADGTVTDIEIRNQVDYMTESAVEALRKSRFRPASINGLPITMYRVLVKIEIELSRRR